MRGGISFAFLCFRSRRLPSTISHRAEPPISTHTASPISSQPNEELAGPQQVTHIAAQPVRLQDRISSIDVLRGSALLGILILNIQNFGDVATLHDLPAGSAIDVFTSPHRHLDFAAILVSWLFFEGKMRGLFSMLFGAGIVLLTTRAERRGSRDVADIYTRRNMWLMVFGLLHDFFIWAGDILFDYGFEALLILFPMRRLRPRTLLWTGTLLSLCISTISVSLFTGTAKDLVLNHKVQQIHEREQRHLPLTASDRLSLSSWDQVVKEKSASPKKTAEAISKARAPYWQAAVARANTNLLTRGGVRRIFSIFDDVPVMLLGMGLMKIGFFSLELETPVYIWTALVGFAISLPLYTVGILKTYAAHLYFLTAEAWLYAPYYLTREAGSLAIAATILLGIRFGLLRFAQHGLQAVGRTAFSNYILTSLLCQTLFVWGPHPLFGKLDTYQLMLAAFAVWAVNLISSTLWLRFFAFGPLEWLWRSLTYWKRQPMLLRHES